MWLRWKRVRFWLPEQLGWRAKTQRFIMGETVHNDAPTRMSFILCFVAPFLSPRYYESFIPGKLRKILSYPFYLAGQYHHTSPCKAHLLVGRTTCIVSLSSKYDSVYMFYVQISTCSISHSTGYMQKAVGQGRWDEASQAVLRDHQYVQHFKQGCYHLCTYVPSIGLLHTLHTVWADLLLCRFSLNTRLPTEYLNMELLAGPPPYGAIHGFSWHVRSLKDFVEARSTRI